MAVIVNKKLKYIGEETQRNVVKGRTTVGTAKRWTAKSNQLSQLSPILGHLFAVFIKKILDCLFQVVILS
jgi:hypothetical protein